MVKCVFLMRLRDLPGSINSIFKFVKLLLSCPPLFMQHLAMDSTGLKV
ncbi:hypothetical protein BTN50_1955 [Candidatus Enterovibrio altilux]|uniref:Mobile element protein n=1 Tax=Candidatus Enterovibrio altilux TaxID=1927128 RepID=A0A291BBI3_9GAMM|nr:hypothetical protein BTN50_1955 [Candidatus Enterovibrio luxaltus]